METQAATLLHIRHSLFNHFPRMADLLTRISCNTVSNDVNLAIYKGVQFVACPGTPYFFFLSYYYLIKALNGKSLLTIDDNKVLRDIAGVIDNLFFPFIVVTMDSM